MESSFIIFLLQPFYKNFNKRITKSPKLYFYDTGVAATLLKIAGPEQLFTHYMYESLFENLVVSEIIKTCQHLGKQFSIYYWRESNGTEIDCILEIGDKTIAFEIKSGQTFTKDYLKNLKKFSPEKTPHNFEKKVIYNGENSMMVNDIELLNWNQFPGFLKNL